MSTSELITMMSNISNKIDNVQQHINNCNNSMDYVYVLIGYNKVKVATGVNETSIFDAISIYDTDLEVLINVIKKYFNELIVVCDELEKNYKLIIKEGNTTNYFLELDSSISLIIDDIKDFMARAIKFNRDFNEYLQDNRIIDVEKTFERIKENHIVLFNFGNIHIIPFYRQHVILQRIENKIHEFAIKNKPF